MLITIFTKNKYSTLQLPKETVGQYKVAVDTEDESLSEVAKIEGIDGKWVLKPNTCAVFINDKTLNSCDVSEQNLYTLQIKLTREKIVLYSQKDDVGCEYSKKTFVSGNDTVTIGSNAGNDICIKNEFVDALHAKITYINNKWVVEDLNSTYGTFVNGNRVSKSELQLGDVVYIMGIKFIIGTDFIAINNPENTVKINASKLCDYFVPKSDVHSSRDYEERDIKYFYRSPRFKRDIETRRFKIDAPPPNAIGEETPLMMVLGPSMTMGLASLTTGIYSVNNALASGDISSAIPSIVMSGSMLLGTVMWPIITKSYDKRRRKKKEATRQIKYSEYLDEISASIRQECDNQARILKENGIPVSECIDRIRKGKVNLWERSISQKDFLNLRLGIGNVDANIEIVYPERRFTVEKDNLLDKMYDYFEVLPKIENVPITFSFAENHLSGIIGDRYNVKEMAKGLILQLASFYGYDELKLVFLYDDEEQDFDFVKWLPHAWNDDRSFRFVATNEFESKELSYYFEKIIESRCQENGSDLSEQVPYYVVFNLSKKLSEKSELLKKLFTQKKKINFSIVTCFDELKDLPKECSTVIEVFNIDNQSVGGKIYDKADISGSVIEFSPDIYLTHDARELSTILANTYLDINSGAFKLPKSVSFLDVFGTNNVEHLNASRRWKENDPTKSLETVVGVDTYGELFKLDLHEKFHGPHGLIAGMTGSGKSEFIITFILSLAVNYHPDEVSFILIDYKGGGMAKAFEKSPHTAGIITNLDGSAVKRSLTSIESELKHRQAIFANVGKENEISNIDIYRYQKLYREGKVSEPLPHLFIISDEFAELKTQQPQFMEKLISAARIGRSLGIHLILATQKPSGVVDDQIWSNSKFKVCLKVQERSDSMDMLKRPDAAELTDTGRFYLQVGYNELFELGQSAWAGAPYVPGQNENISENSISVIDTNGKTVQKIGFTSKTLSVARKQLDVITEYLCDVAKLEKAKARPLWLEPLPGTIYLNEIKRDTTLKNNNYEICPVVGVIDDPESQSQYPLEIPISQNGNTIIYGSTGSGKTTFLTTMIYSLLTDKSADELNLYILDFASETLREFSNAPHVGDVILSYENEKTGNLFKLLNKKLNERKKLFSNFGGDYKSYISNSENKVPSIVVVINNYSAFAEIYDEYENSVNYLTREGAKYGIYFVITVNSTSAVRYRTQQNFNQFITMRLNDESEYSSVVGRTDGLYPANFKGRGLIKTDKIYEFQTAHIDGKPTFMQIDDWCRNLSETSETKAEKVPILPEVVDFAFLSEFVDTKSNKIPIGVDVNTLQVSYYPVFDKYISLVLSSSGGHSEFIGEIASILNQFADMSLTVIDVDSDLEIIENVSLKYHNNKKRIDEFIDKLFDVVVYRNNTYKDSVESGTACEDFDLMTIVINSVSKLKETLDDTRKEKLELILEKGCTEYGVYIVIAESVKLLSSVAYDSWFKKQISLEDAVWVGNGITEQYQLNYGKATSDMREDLSNSYGYNVQKAKAQKIKMLSSGKEGEI